MKTHPLGSAGPPVSALALGCMGMSDWYGPADEAENIATIHAAIDAGINLLDTGVFYGMGHNEMLLGRALEGRRMVGKSVPAFCTWPSDSRLAASSLKAGAERLTLYKHRSR